MNTKNNKRRQETLHRIQSVFLDFLQTRELGRITVSDICKTANINRSTFYANYMDVYDLADKIREKLESDVSQIYSTEHDEQVNSNDYLKLFRHIYENQIFYKTYFKLGYDKGQMEVFEYDYHMARDRFNDQYIDYHIEFFRNGLNSIIKKWLDGGCKETPEEMNQILISEYVR